MLKEFLRDKTPAQLVMLGALVLLLVSQFFPYMDADLLGTVTSTGTFIPNPYFNGVPAGTGWELHPHAYVILLLLAFAFLRDDITTSRVFSRFGWWASVVLFIAAISPGAPLRTLGASLGAVAVFAALGAAILHHLQSRRASRGP